jgi:hypothetical protein
VKTSLLTLLTTLSLAGSAWSAPKPAPKKPAPVPAPKVDIRQWPVYPGAVSQDQLMMDGAMIIDLAGKNLAPREKEILSKLGGVQILTYRLTPDRTARSVIAHYEPNALRAGYKLMIKHLGEDDDDDELTAAAVYTHPGGGVLVVSLDGDEDKGGKNITLSVVSVIGSLNGLADLARIQGLAEAAGKGTPAPKPAPAPAVEP